MKIGIADPQARVRFSLRVLLEQHAGWLVTGEAADCEELFAMFSASAPDLLLLDWELPDLLPEGVVRRLRSRSPGLKIIVMSGRPELQQAALQAGADAFASKADSPEKLLSVILDQCAC